VLLTRTRGVLAATVDLNSGLARVAFSAEEGAGR
jgi:hypothetical protein